MDHHRAIHQLDPKPFIYDSNYSELYDTQAYRQEEVKLQALRLGFTLACHGRPINHLIDVGYGNGAFIKAALKNIPKVGGLDVTDVPVPEGAYSTRSFEPCEAMTFWDSMEHFPNLSFIKDLSVETVVISLPNTCCTPSQNFYDWFTTWHHQKPNEHLHFFNSHSLNSLMNESGYRQVAFGYHEDVVRKRATGGPGNILSMGLKKREL